MAGTPQPGSAAAIARQFYKTHSHLTTSDALVKAMVEDPAYVVEPTQWDAVRRAFQRILQGAVTLDGHVIPPHEREARNEDEEPSVSIDAEDEEPWRVVDEHYEWEVKGAHGRPARHFRLSVEQVDELFFNYSKHGLNLSQTQVINKFRLSTWQWNSMKARLMLNKLSNVFSPHTWDTTAPELREKMVAAKIAVRYKDTGLIIEQQHHAATHKKYEKVIQEAEQTKFLNDSVLVELADRFPEAKVRYLLRAPVGPSAPNVLAFTLADTHAGAKIKNMIRSFDYDREQMYDYADQLIAEVNAVGAGQVWLLGLGDYIETLTGLNHPNSWKGADLFGADAIAHAYEFFVYFIDRIVNLRGILSVGGNHDRITSSAKEDTAAQVAQAVFYFLKLNYGKLLDIEFNPALVTREIDGINYILKHGYTGDVSNEKKATDLIADFQTRGVFTLLLTADKHTRGVFLDGNRKRWVRSPAFFTGNQYSEDLGFTGLAGSLLIRAVKGFPHIVDVPLIPLDKNNTFNRSAA
ncbi:hypothetical protein [Hymenobacter metallicola]|uniref:Uncharacterized protein n=1 Tax=Hymenobacter metallicola TaxID=2563114 RepID=A0A4Z0QJ29_9BACT|nr:hypothetical protein [Hymenobacter metallicola]TGE29784.1 hypothetical protein E5K02_10095 [Hymenobacter metallicola]